MKARPTALTKAYRQGQIDGFKKARKALGAVIDMAILDVLDATPEQILAVERKVTEMLDSVAGGWLTLDAVVEAREEEIGHG